MKMIKQILMFILTGAVLSIAAIFVTQAIFYKVDIAEYGLWQLLIFDYGLSYLLYPLLYRKKMQDIFPNKYVFTAIIFCLFWIVEIVIMLCHI